MKLSAATRQKREAVNAIKEYIGYAGPQTAESIAKVVFNAGNPSIYAPIAKRTLDAMEVVGELTAIDAELDVFYSIAV